VITQINREKLSEVNELDNIVSRYGAGTQILITYVRNGQQTDAPVILAEQK
jgi:S1-C subfamily serine protease